MYLLYSPQIVVNSYDIANTINNYFAAIAQSIKKHEIFTYFFSDYLRNESNNAIFIQSTSKEDMASIISSLNSDKASDPNNIPYKILFPLKNKMSRQLTHLFKLSFMIFVFLLVLKTANVIPVFEKD